MCNPACQNPLDLHPHILLGFSIYNLQGLFSAFVLCAVKIVLFMSLDIFVCFYHFRLYHSRQTVDTCFDLFDHLCCRAAKFKRNCAPSIGDQQQLSYNLTEI